MEEMLPKLTDEITTLNDQGIPKKKKQTQNLKFVPHQRQPHKILGACRYVGHRNGFEIS